MAFSPGTVYFFLIFICNLVFNSHLSWEKDPAFIEKNDTSSIYIPPSALNHDSINVDIKIQTFLGNKERNYYGNSLPDKLSVIWKIYLGHGKTLVSIRTGPEIWAGAGWTGQPLLVNERDTLFLIQGSYDHKLKKINSLNGEIIWQYEFDDVVKGTGTIWENKNSDNLEEKYVILQGSRLGLNNYLDSKHVPSFRAISYITGRELWRLDVKWTDSYSRDVDGSALIINDTAYLGLENSIFTVFDPDCRNAVKKDNMLQPKIFQEIDLYEKQDVILHNYNIVTEASPCLLGNRIYIASGSGHVYGYDLRTKQIEWDFYIGSDIDGSPVVTSDSCLLISVEKQYIAGRGGAFKIDPSKDPENSVIWYFPTGDRNFASWSGGIIGTIGINDFYLKQYIPWETAFSPIGEYMFYSSTMGLSTYPEKSDYPYIAAFIAIDGYLYVVSHKTNKEGAKVTGPNNIEEYNTPKLLFKKYVGPSISTPIIIRNKLVAAGYHGIYLFEFDENMNFNLLDHFPGSYEATPIAYNNRLYIASRGGYLYCLGEIE